MVRFDKNPWWFKRPTRSLKTLASSAISRFVRTGSLSSVYALDCLFLRVSDTIMPGLKKCSFVLDVSRPRSILSLNSH